MSFFFGSVGPDDFAKNYANWARKWGLIDWADWLAQYATGPRVFWTVVSVSLIYLVIVFGLPALIRKSSKKTAITYVPLCATVLILGSLYAWYSITKIGEWYISPTQEADLRAAVAAAPRQISPVLITTVPAAGTYEADDGSKCCEAQLFQRSSLPAGRRCDPSVAVG